MSPEQARGRPADKRSDIWAFGAVLYEALTGKRAFDGDDISFTLANILKSEPDWNALTADTPPVVRRVLRRCLEKDPKLRFHDIADARLDLDEKDVAVAAPPPPARPASSESGANGVGAPRRGVDRSACLRRAAQSACAADRSFSDRATGEQLLRCQQRSRTSRWHEQRSDFTGRHTTRVPGDRKARAITALDSSARFVYGASVAGHRKCAAYPSGRQTAAGLDSSPTGR